MADFKVAVLKKVLGVQLKSISISIQVAAIAVCGLGLMSCGPKATPALPATTTTQSPFGCSSDEKTAIYSAQTELRIIVQTTTNKTAEIDHSSNQGNAGQKHALEQFADIAATSSSRLGAFRCWPLVIQPLVDKTVACENATATALSAFAINIASASGEKYNELVLAATTTSRDSASAYAALTAALGSLQPLR